MSCVRNPQPLVNDNQTTAEDEGRHPYLAVSCVGSYLGSLHFRFYSSETGRRNHGFCVDLAFVSVRQ